MEAKKYLWLFCVILFSSCINNTEDLTPTDIIDPEDVSYSEDIQPIFNQTCGGSGCHIPGSQNGVNLSSYSSAISSIGLNYGTDIIVPGSPDDSPLVDKIESDDPEWGSRMPLTGGYLTTDEIATIRAWIEAGAEDN